MKEWLEFAPAWVLLKFVGTLPRPVARALAVVTVRILLFVAPKLKRVAMFNLQIAFPDWSDARRKQTIGTMARYLAWQAVEFARFPRYKRSNIENVIEIEGHENFLEAQRRGKGVLILTGHIGAWELSSFAHAVYGYPMHYMARPLDNARLDAFVNRYRELSGNKPIYKNESARAVLKTLHGGGIVGILADQNTLPEEGTFVEFFGKPACTTTGIARLALHTGAPIVPGYAYWDEKARKYKLRFDPPVELIVTGNSEQDIRENTQRFAQITENIIRQFPTQWVWLHARWKTRPKGEPPLYDFL
ncbi:MAG: lysophospholipid acyltransferase family protein [Acidobacteria bacterium]|nr:lysophospholipid acyltransferase family protein [Acidobacteriota bacterium]MBS1865241.1 lysophospholipid acyltransferase family protein [Acidobacteriota bacterium]